MSVRRTNPPARSRRSKKSAGYTMIEVMMALGVLTIGAVGLMALQTASTRGNMEAREMTVGTQLTERWVERLRMDGLNWTRHSDGIDATLLANTDYLRFVPNPGATPQWFVPAPPAPPTSAQFDYFGNDTTTPSQMHYCTNVRLEWLYTGRALRADVRVWWLRRQAGAHTDGTRANLINCAPGTGLNALTTDNRVRMVYASTVIRWTPPAQP